MGNSGNSMQKFNGIQCYFGNVINQPNIVMLYSCNENTLM